MKPRILEPRKTPDRAYSYHVVVEISSDGFIQVFGDKNVQVQIINRPVATSPESGKVCDEIVREILPRAHKEVYFPGMVRKTGLARVMTLKKINELLADTLLLQALGGKTDSTREIVKTIITA